MRMRTEEDRFKARLDREREKVLRAQDRAAAKEAAHEARLRLKIERQEAKLLEQEERRRLREQAKEQRLVAREVERIAAARASRAAQRPEDLDLEWEVLVAEWQVSRRCRRCCFLYCGLCFLFPS